jgi:hypothetical protein
MSTTEHQKIGALLYLGVPDGFPPKFMYGGQYFYTDFPATLMRVVRPCLRSLGFLRFVCIRFRVSNSIASRLRMRLVMSYMYQYLPVEG